MRAICIDNRGSALSSELRESIIHDTHPEDYRFHIEVGITYTVLALSVAYGHTYFGIWSDDKLGFQLLPAELFEIVDHRLSGFWRVSYQKPTSELPPFTFFGHPETVNDREHINGLLEGRDEDVALLKKYREPMDLEFSDPSITVEAEQLEGKWLLCPNCSEAWEEGSTFDLVKCPRCCAVMNRPP